MSKIEQKITTIKRFITGQLTASGMKGFVLGLSGGIDSAVSAVLAVEAIGNDKVLGIMMPYRTSSDNSLSDAKALAKHLNISTRQIEISPMIDAYFPTINDDIKLRAGNKMARERMSILFDIAAETSRLVLGTGNRTEICLGYTTWYGDSACSINPIGELYKTEVREIARYFELPDSIISKPPSADLWAGQTDEKEIGVTYELIDRLLECLIDQGTTSMSQLEAQGFSSTDISKVVSLLNRNWFKRQLPAIAPLGKTAIPRHLQLVD